MAPLLPPRMDGSYNRSKLRAESNLGAFRVRARNAATASPAPVDDSFVLDKRTDFAPSSNC